MSDNKVIELVKLYVKLIHFLCKVKDDSSINYAIKMDKLIIEEISKNYMSEDDIKLIMQERRLDAREINAALMPFNELLQEVKDMSEQVKEFIDMGDEENTFDAMCSLKETIYHQFLLGEFSSEQCATICKVIVDADLV